MTLSDAGLVDNLETWTHGPSVATIPTALWLSVLHELQSLRLIEAAARQAATGPVAESAHGLEVLACELTVLDLERAGGMQGVGWP